MIAIHIILSSSLNLAVRCLVCDLSFCSEYRYRRHLTSAKHAALANIMQPRLEHVAPLNESCGNLGNCGSVGGGESSTTIGNPMYPTSHEDTHQDMSIDDYTVEVQLIAVHVWTVVVGKSNTCSWYFIVM